MSESFGAEFYDVAKWKPITPQTYVSSLAEAGMTMDDPETLTVEFTQLPDTRHRLTLLAEVVRRDVDMPESLGRQPYLLVIHCPETGASVCMIRTDVELANV